MLLSFLLGYACGCFPTGPLVARRRGVDLRQFGSGNIGASNAVRALGWKRGGLVFLGDGLKGFVPVAVAALFFGDVAAPEAAALGAVVGHLWPITLGFRGGKGVATAFGAFLALAPGAALLSLGLWAVLVAVTRKSSLGSLAAAVALPVLLWWSGAEPLTCLTALLISLLVAWKHRANVGRLRRGEENSL